MPDPISKALTILIFGSGYELSKTIHYLRLSKRTPFVFKDRKPDTI
jgi:hypothetical protein